MTVQEVIERVKKSDEFYHSEENQIIIQALEEVEQYRALGTVEELKEAREKQIAKKPNIVGEFFRLAECSDCHTVIQFKQEYCHKCGNKVDWEEGGTSEEA